MDHAMANEAKLRKMYNTEVYQIPTPYQAISMHGEYTYFTYLHTIAVAIRIYNYCILMHASKVVKFNNFSTHVTGIYANIYIMQYMYVT